MLLTFLLFLIAFVPYSSSQFLNCQFVASLNCDGYPTAQECATNGITYTSRCAFAKARCIDKDLHIYHDGPCVGLENSTPGLPGLSTTPKVDGEEAVLDFFCTSLSKIPCSIESNPVCGTDGRTYKNYCEYDKARCTHRNLHVASFGQC